MRAFALAALAVFAAALLGPAKPATAQPPAQPVDIEDCIACHTEDDWKTLRPGRPAFDHERVGFPLLGRHSHVPCAACHGNALKVSNTPSECGACHEDPHRGSLGRACDRCHEPSSWPPTGAFLRHRQTRFPLAGAHAAADCTACHRRARSETYTGTPTACYACHATDYAAPTVHPNHVKAGFRQQCDTCHSQYTWFPARVRHDLFFPLRGAHAAAACDSCHGGGRYGGTPQTCAGCHRTDHQATRSPPHVAHRIGTDCARCHTDSTWHPARGTWHDAALLISRGPHAGTACHECHAPSATQFTFQCVSCHPRAPMDAEHSGISGYVWQDFACYSCHPAGLE